jgi:hypothetical protein
MEGRKWPSMPELQSPGISQMRKKPRMWSMRYAWKYLRYKAHSPPLQRERLCLCGHRRQLSTRLLVYHPCPKAMPMTRGSAFTGPSLTLPCAPGAVATSGSHPWPSPPSCTWGSPSSGRWGQSSREARLQQRVERSVPVCGMGSQPRSGAHLRPGKQPGPQGGVQAPESTQQAYAPNEQLPHRC